LAISILPNRVGSDFVFDTGGELVELGDLANLVVELVNPNAEIRRSLDLALPQDSYHSDNAAWFELTDATKIGQESLKDQISRILAN
jgi:hypothetical protein